MKIAEIQKEIADIEALQASLDTFKDRRAGWNGRIEIYLARDNDDEYEGSPIEDLHAVDTMKFLDSLFTAMEQEISRRRIRLESLS